MRELSFRFNAPATIRHRGVVYRMYGDGRHYSKKKVRRIVNRLREDGEYYFTTRRWRSGVGDLTNNYLVYIRKRSLGMKV